MNNTIRRELRKQIKLLQDCLDNLVGANEVITEFRDEESDKVDNAPENLMNTERYERMEEIVENLDNAVDCLEDAVGSLSDTMESLETAIE